jgi:hypothetical protein
LYTATCGTRSQLKQIEAEAGQMCHNERLMLHMLQHPEFNDRDIDSSLKRST